MCWKPARQALLYSMNVASALGGNVRRDDQSSAHLCRVIFGFLVSGGSRAARIASSNTFFSPFCKHRTQEKRKAQHTLWQQETQALLFWKRARQDDQPHPSRVSRRNVFRRARAVAAQEVQLRHFNDQGPISLSEAEQTGGQHDIQYTTFEEATSQRETCQAEAPQNLPLVLSIALITKQAI